MLARTLFRWGAPLAGTLMLSACSLLQTDSSVAPMAVSPATPASAPVVVAPPALPQPDPADLAARRFLAYHEQVRQMSPTDLGNEITRLSGVVSSTATAAPADSVLELSLALTQQHNGGDLTRASALLDPLAKSNAPELAPWQALARLLLGRVAEQRRLEDQLAREVAQRREQQRNLQQLSEKLEALKAIERSMTTRLPGAASAPAQAPASAPAAAPLAPKAP
ncbi:MAG: hypothetical protein ABI605_11735 [Rhizobacter sp.]